MKRLVKNAVCMVLCVIMVALFFAGCTSKNGTIEQEPKQESKQESTGSTQETTKPPTKIRIMNRVNAAVVIENNPMLKEVERLNNVILEYDAPPVNNYVDKLQIVMASGDLPDIIYNWGAANADYEKWAQSDLLAVLDDKIANYPNLMANLSEEMWEMIRSVYTGKIHAIPKANQDNYWGYIINQDWLNTLGLKPPATLDEFTEVCRAFSTRDPDGNGKDDTYGVSCTEGKLGKNSFWNLHFLTDAFDINILSKDADGNYKILEKHAGYLPYLKYIKMLYSEKLLDPEFFTNKGSADRDKQDQNRVGIIDGHQGGANRAYSDEIPLSKFSYYPPLANSKGDRVYYVTPAHWGAWMISSTAKDIDACLKLIDWGYTQEGFVLTTLGIKGMHYTEYDFEKRMVVRTDEQAELAKTHASTYMNFTNALGGLTATIATTPERAEKVSRELSEAKKVAKIVDCPVVKIEKLWNLPITIPDLVKKKDDYELKFVMGEISEEDIKNFLEKEYFPKVEDAEKEFVDYMNAIDKK